MSISVFGQSISGVVARYRERQARRSTLAALSSLDTATLRDMGMSRSELASVSFSHNPDRRRRHV